MRRAQLEGELAAERRSRRAGRSANTPSAWSAWSACVPSTPPIPTLAPLAERLAAALSIAGEAVAARTNELRQELDTYRAAGEEMAGELRACAAQEAEIQARLRAQGEAVTAAEVAAQRLRDHTEEAALELRTVREQLESPAASEGAVEGDVDPNLEEATPAEDEGEVAVAVAGERGGDRGMATDLRDGDGETMQDGHDAEAVAGDDDPEPLTEEQVQSLTARLERLRRRREQLGPVNPLAKEEYAEALAHVEELEARRSDLETALRELRTLIRDTDRQIHETFRTTFEAAARNFEELARDLFPGGGGQLRLVKDALAPRPVLGGQPLPGAAVGAAGGGSEERDGEAAAEREELAGVGGAAAKGGSGEGGDGESGDAPHSAGSAEFEDDRSEIGQQGVEIEITPAGKSTKRLSLLSGGEKSMTALAFLFAVFLARPCPFYILDEVEAALDDLNLERFLSLLRRYADRAQFIVITHQKRTMEAADWLYGVSMAGNGVSKVLSRRLPPAAAQEPADAASAPVAQAIPAPAPESALELRHETTPEVGDAAEHDDRGEGLSETTEPAGAPEVSRLAEVA